MPRGVAKAGYRKPRKNKLIRNDKPTIFFETKETDKEIEDRLFERFDILQSLCQQACQGDIRALIVSGPPGLGKSFTVEQELRDWDPNERNHTIIKGYVKATGLYKLLWQYKNKGQVIVFDDADSVFFDDTSLNLIKAICDTNDIRRVSYLAEGGLVDEETASRIPKQFEFNGTVIFITNYDFDMMIDRGHKLAPHLQALVSRSHYIDLTLKTARDYIIRIKQVINNGLLDNKGLNKQEQKDCIDFIENNKEKLRELSLRIALKIAAIRKSNKPNWKSIARITCCRN